MEREIKFRVWHKQLGQMLGHDWLNSTGARYDILFSQHENSVMQFTGLKDKNGKEIYQGDIVHFHANYSSSPCGYMNGLVTFKHLQWMIRSGNHLYSIYEETDEFDSKSEVIGNIYENPELLNN